MKLPTNSLSNLLIIILSTLLIVMLPSTMKRLSTTKATKLTYASSSQEQCKDMQSLINYTFPPTDRIINFDPRRPVIDLDIRQIEKAVAYPTLTVEQMIEDCNPSLTTIPIKDVLKKGRNVKYKVLYTDPHYLRPLYNPAWKEVYVRSWSLFPNRISDAQHQLFTLGIGLSTNYDICNELALEGVEFDYDKFRDKICIIYNFTVNKVTVYGDQIILTGCPTRTGIQIIGINQNKALHPITTTKNYLMQLATPGGYEMDHLVTNLFTYEYWKKDVQESLPKDTKVFKNTRETSPTSEECKKMELLINNTFPRTDDIINLNPIRPPLGLSIDQITHATSCYKVSPEEINSYSNPPLDVAPIKTVLRKGKDIRVKVLYYEPLYLRPLYDPNWKSGSYRSWSSFPSRIFDAQHHLFTLYLGGSSNYDVFNELALGDVAFTYDKFRDKICIIYNFTVEKITVYGDQVVLTGLPSRTGLQVIGINQNDTLAPITTSKDYLIQLVTPDGYEIDHLLTDFFTYEYWKNSTH